MVDRVLITLREENVAPRFDLATEVLIVTLGPRGEIREQKTMILPHASPEDLCQQILTEEVQTVICGGIEEEFHQYLTWKKRTVLDSVMGPWKLALERYRQGRLQAGAILYEQAGTGHETHR